MSNRDLLDAGVADIARGYRQEGDSWVCLLCGEAFENGVVYMLGDRQYEASRAVREHIRSAHEPVFRHLLATQREHAGLTERQAEILSLMFDGNGDKAIAERLTGSDNTSSVRNLRFQLKEREKQAKAYLALMEAFRAERRDAKAAGSAAVPPPSGAMLADERFAITEQERYAVLKAYFNADGSLRDFPVREKRKVIVLMELAKRFEKGREYTEKEVNERIAWRDFATVRRYLVEYGFLGRDADCGRYWRPRPDAAENS